MPLTYPDVKSGQGTKISFASGFTSEFTEIKATGPKADVIIVTKLSSTAVEKIQAPIFDAGQLSGKIHYNPANRPTLGGTASTDTVTIFYPTNGTDTADTDRQRASCPCFLTGIEHEIAVSPKLIEGTINIECTGAWSYTAQS